MKPSLFYILLLIVAFLMLLACERQTPPVAQLEVNDICIEEYEFDCITMGLEGCKLIVQCEEDLTPISKTSKKKKTRKNAFQKHVHYFLQLMQSGKIAEASEFSTEHGLKSFLNFDIDQIKEFSIRQTKADDVLGTAKIKINELPEKMFYFNKRGDQWTFIGTDDWKNT